MPIKDPEKRKQYFKEYHQRKKKAVLQEPQPEPAKTSWSTKVYEGPPIASTEVMEDIVSGMTQKELNSLNEDIQDALEPKEIPPRYQRLKAEALNRVKSGESSLIFDIDNSKVMEIDFLKDFKSKPIEPIDEDSEVWTWRK